MASTQPQATEPSEIGEVLQSATTVAGLAVAFAAILPSLKVSPTLYFFGLPPLQSISTILLLCGILALYGSTRALHELLTEKGLTTRVLFSLRHSIGILFWAIFLLGIVYILIFWVVLNSPAERVP